MALRKMMRDDFYDAFAYRAKVILCLFSFASFGDMFSPRATPMRQH